jgi:hypothetical protein
MDGILNSMEGLKLGPAASAARVPRVVGQHLSIVKRFDPRTAAELTLLKV